VPAGGGVAVRLTAKGGEDPFPHISPEGRGTAFPGQGYFAYASQKSGAVTGSHLRFGPDPIRSDREVTEAELKAHHVVLIGRPDSNSVVERFRKELPIAFGKRSFVVRGQTYASAGRAGVARSASGSRASSSRRATGWLLLSVTPVMVPSCDAIMITATPAM